MPIGKGNLEQPIDWNPSPFKNPAVSSGMHPVGGGNLTQAPPFRPGGGMPGFQSTMRPVGGGNLEPPINWGAGGGGWNYAGGAPNSGLHPIGGLPAYRPLTRPAGGPWANHFRQIMRNRRGGF